MERGLRKFECSSLEIWHILVCLCVVPGELRCCDEAETEQCRHSCRHSLTAATAHAHNDGHLSDDDVITRIAQHCGHIHYSVSRHRCSRNVETSCYVKVDAGNATSAVFIDNVRPSQDRNYR